MKLSQKIRNWGFKLRLKSNGNLGITPFDELTEDQLSWIKENKPAIVDELVEERKEYESAKKNDAAKGFAAREANAAPRVSVGTILEQVIQSKVPDSLLSLVPKATCGCSDYIKKMNKWGIDGCVQRKREIVKHLVSQSEKMGAIASAVPESFRRKMAEKMFDRAIAIAVEKAEDSSE
jgi:hypothetical protein